MRITVFGAKVLRATVFSPGYQKPAVLMNEFAAEPLVMSELAQLADESQKRPRDDASSWLRVIESVWLNIAILSEKGTSVVLASDPLHQSHRSGSNELKGNSVNFADAATTRLFVSEPRGRSDGCHRAQHT